MLYAMLLCIRMSLIYGNNQRANFQLLYCLTEIRNRELVSLLYNYGREFCVYDWLLAWTIARRNQIPSDNVSTITDVKSTSHTQVLWTVRLVSRKTNVSCSTYDRFWFHCIFLVYLSYHYVYHIHRHTNYLYWLCSSNSKLMVSNKSSYAIRLGHLRLVSCQRSVLILVSM